MKKNGLKKAIKAAGSVSALARSIGADRTSMQRWTHVPEQWIIKIEHATGVPREELRPDLYLAPRPNKIR